MSILRTGILVAVVVAILPADREQQAALYDRAASAVHWTATFCERNGPTCEQAGVVWEGFVKKAQFGAAMAYELVTNSSGEGKTVSLIEPTVDMTPRGTLRAEDLEPVWRGATPGRI
ncbi:MAG TPA: DUF5330 domain-containing protein [Hyphomicrobium sp.]|nr:DUF5330 domain-containing protein [Hyphomicrobium sp.]